MEIVLEHSFEWVHTWGAAMSSTEHFTSTPDDSERLIRFIVAGCTVGWFVLLIGLTWLAG